MSSLHAPDTFELPFEQNGHFLTSQATARLLHLEEGHPPLLLDTTLHCHRCDRRPHLLVEDGLVRAQEPCALEEGITTTITLALPSGKLLVSDDLRPVYALPRELEDTFASYNTHLGQAQVVEAMASIGCAYGPVGNASPGLYRTGPDTFVVAALGYEEDEEGFEAEPTPPGELLASVCTDLWAYSMADYEHWIARGGDPATLGWSDTVVELPAGTYSFTHHTGERSFEHDAPGTIIYAHVERIS